MALKIAVDFGGVCSVHSERYEAKDMDGLEPINVPGCVEALQEMKKQGHKLYLLSFCGAKRAKSTRDYLNEKHKDLFDVLIFVKNRKFKANLCAKHGIDVLIDDRQDILSNIKPTQSILFTYEDTLAGKAIQAPKNMAVASSWEEVLKVLPSIKKLDLPEQPDVIVGPMCY